MAAVHPPDGDGEVEPPERVDAAFGDDEEYEQDGDCSGDFNSGGVENDFRLRRGSARFFGVWDFVDDFPIRILIVLHWMLAVSSAGRASSFAERAMLSIGIRIENC